MLESRQALERYLSEIADNSTSEQGLINELSALISSLSIDQSHLTNLLVQQLDRMSKERGVQNYVNRDVIIARTDRVVISVSILPPHKPESISSNPDITLITILNDSELNCILYTSDDLNIEVFDKAKRLRVEKQFSIKSGEVAVFSDPKKPFSIELIKTTHVLRAVVTNTPPHRNTQIWSFNPETLDPVSVMSSAVKFTALTHVCEYLSGMESTDSFDSIKYAAETSEAHTLRWAAMKALALLDGDRSIATIESATRDIHPHIRSAAIFAMLALENT